jgi:hypothetical protein
MLKHFAVCAVLLVLGTGSVNAQQQDVVLRKIEVPGADFDVVFVMSKAQAAATIGLRSPENSLVVRSIGDELAFATDGEIERIFGSSRYLIHACRVERKDSDPSSAVHVYVVSKGARTASH